MLAQSSSRLKRRGSWIIRKKDDSDYALRKRDKEDEKHYSRLKRDNPSCADCAAKGAKWASVSAGVLLCIECSGAHLSLGLPIKHINDLDHSELERTAAMYLAANLILERSIPAPWTKPSQSEPLYVEVGTCSVVLQQSLSFHFVNSDGRRAFAEAKYVKLAFRGDLTFPHDITPQVLPDVVKAGYVYMKENNKFWPRRYCVLTTYMSFYRLPTDTVPELVLELRFSSVLPMTAYPGGCRIKILTPSTSNRLVLQADSPADAQEWLTALQNVCKIVLSQEEKSTHMVAEDEDVEPLTVSMHRSDELDLDIHSKRREEEQADVMAAMTMSGSSLPRQRSLNAPPLMEGSLLTMSHSKVWKEWRKRWFVLSKGHLRIFRSKNESRLGSKPLTAVRLLHCNVKASDRFEDKKLCFEIAAPDQSIFALAENADEMRNWIFSIRQASGRLLVEAMADASIIDQEENTSQGTDENEMHHSGERAGKGTSGALIGRRQEQLAAAGAILEGFLYKRKSSAKSGKRVWAALKADSLHIFKQPGDVTPLVSANLLTSSVKVIDPVNHCFDVVLPHMSFHLQAESANDLANWLAALRGVIESLLSNFKKTPRSPLLARPRALSTSVVPDARLTGICTSMMLSSSDDDVGLDSSTEDSQEDDRVLKPPALLEAVEQADNAACADCNKRDPRWVSINLGLYLCIECSGIHRSLGVHISKVRSIELDLWDQETVKFMLEMGNKKANRIWEYHVAPEFECMRPGPNSDRTTREDWIKEKYVKKTFANMDEVMRLEAARPAAAPASTNSPRSLRNSSGQRTTQRKGPQATSTWRPWQGVAKKKRAQYREGYLNHRSKISKAWSKRWFVLKNTVLYYYKVRGDNQPAGIIDLVECCLRKSETAKKPNAFEIVTPTRVYVLYADTPVSMKEWIAVLNKAVNAGNGLYLDKQSTGHRSVPFPHKGHSGESSRPRDGWVVGQFPTYNDDCLTQPKEEQEVAAQLPSRTRRPSFGHQRMRVSEGPTAQEVSYPLNGLASNESGSEASSEAGEDPSTSDSSFSNSDLAVIPCCEANAEEHKHNNGPSTDNKERGVGTRQQLAAISIRPSEVQQGLVLI